MAEIKKYDEKTAAPSAQPSLAKSDFEIAQRLAEQADVILLACQNRALQCPSDILMSTFLGFPLAGLNTIEQAAVHFYREGSIPPARRLFRLVLGLSELCGAQRPTALRGLAACDHQENNYAAAVDFYRQALTLDPQDALSLAALAECLEHIGPDKWAFAGHRRSQQS